MERKERQRIFVNVERLNRLNTEGCMACGRKFSLGDEVVLARGRWTGVKYIHKNEAVFDQHSNEHYERRYFRAKKGMSG